MSILWDTQVETMSDGGKGEDANQVADAVLPPEKRIRVDVEDVTVPLAEPKHKAIIRMTKEQRKNLEKRIYDRSSTFSSDSIDPAVLNKILAVIFVDNDGGEGNIYVTFDENFPREADGTVPHNVYLDGWSRSQSTDLNIDEQKDRTDWPKMTYHNFINYGEQIFAPLDWLEKDQVKRPTDCDDIWPRLSILPAPVECIKLETNKHGIVGNMRVFHVSSYC